MVVRRTAPDSFETFVRDYDHFLEVIITRISRGSVRPDDLPDLKQAVYARIWETQYLDRYRPEKGSFSNYLYILVRSVLVNQFDKNTRNPLNFARGTTERLGSPTAGPQRLVLEAHADLQDAEWERRQQAADLMTRLAEYTATVRESAELSEVLRLFYEGHTPAEVATRLGQKPERLRECREWFRHVLQAKYEVAG